MFGNLLSGDLIAEYVDKKIIVIDPFDEKLLTGSHYPLYPSQISFMDSELKIHDFSDHGKEIELPPLQYGRIKINETIKLSTGIIGIFAPASNNIERGFMLTVGKLDPGYNKNIVFGIFNASGKNALLSSEIHIAHIRFYDLRAVTQSERVTEYLDFMSRYRDDEPIETNMLQLEQKFLKRKYSFGKYKGD